MGRPQQRLSGVRLVRRHGVVQECEASGLADTRAGSAWTARTTTQVASISKQFVAVVTLLLAERQSLRLDDPVTALLPTAPSPWRRVELRHLLTHTSGLPHWCPLPGFDPAVAIPPEERLQQLLEGLRPDERGAIWRYSSPGYIVLAAALEHASGRSYVDLVSELVIDKLALAGTSLGTPRGAQVARGHRAGEPVDPWDLSTMPGTGDVWSDAGDIAAFVEAVHGGTLLPPHAQDLLREVSVPTRPDAPPPGAVTTQRYGLGHFIGSVDGVEARLHPGDNPGYQAVAAWFPDTHTTIVLVSNEETDDLETLLSETAQLASVTNQPK